VIGDHAAQDCIEEMHQRCGSHQGRRIHLGSDEKETGKISKELVEIHELPLTLPSTS
jgi:hypothetical protein